MEFVKTERLPKARLCSCCGVHIATFGLAFSVHLNHQTLVLLCDTCRAVVLRRLQEAE